MNIRSTATCSAVVLVGSFLALSGCSPAPLPRYPLMNARQSLDAMRARSAEIRSVSGRGELGLDDPEHGTVRFEAAFVMRPPQHARVRAWKLGHAVFDLTATPDGVWIYTPEEQATEGVPNPNRSTASPLSATLARTSDALPDWMAVLWGHDSPDTREAGTRTTELQGPMLVLNDALASGGCFRRTVRRATLTTERAEVFDSDGASLFTLDLSDYRELRGVVWPCTIVASSSGGRVTILTRDLVTNAESDAAFTPAARSRKLP